MPNPTPEALARLFHDTYERLALGHGYLTRVASAKPWPEVPEANRTLMIATCVEVLKVLTPPDAFTLLVYIIGGDASAIAWTGNLPQYEFDNRGDAIDSWGHDYNTPQPDGLWLAAGTVFDRAPSSIEWRRLTSAEAVACADGQWPLDGSAT